MKINILCLYYDLMNLYGDTGNIKVLKYHLEELGIKYTVTWDAVKPSKIINATLSGYNAGINL